MRRLFWLLVLLPVISVAAEQREYGASTTVNVCLFDYDTPVDLVDLTAVTFATGDVTVQKDEAASVNIGTLPTEDDDCVAVALTATEMQAARIVVKIQDQTASKVWMDEAVVIETYGDASAQHPDLGATQPWNPAWDAEVESEATDALTAYSATATTDLPTNFGDLSITASTGLVDITQGAADKAWSTATRVLTANTNLNDVSVTDIRDLVIEDQGSITLGCALAAVLARQAGDWSGTTSVIYQDATGVETRVTVDLATADQRDGTITCPTY